MLGSCRLDLQCPSLEGCNFRQSLASYLVLTALGSSTQHEKSLDHSLCLYTIEKYPRALVFTPEAKHLRSSRFNILTEI